MATATAIAVAVGAAAVAPAVTPVNPERITSAGAGDVKLNATYRSLRRKGLLGRVRPGCELGGPNTRSASLRAPLQGFVSLTLTSPRRVAMISVTGGAAARGVGVDATTRDIKDAFPKAKLDHSTDEVFGVTLVTVPRGRGGRLAFAVDTRTKKVTVIGIPGIPFCD